MLDVQQIFGRAGRPQFEDEGLGIIITQHAQLAHYLGMLTHQAPIESKFTGPLVDNLNAEIVLGESAAPLCNTPVGDRDAGANLCLMSARCMDWVCQASILSARCAHLAC